MIDAIEAIVRSYREQVAEARGGTPERRPIGWARGVLPELPDSFFEPLPQDVIDLFGGKSA